MIVNFSHPLTDEQLADLRGRIGASAEPVVEVKTQVDTDEPLTPQVAALADAAGLSPEEWQTRPIVVNPPSLNYIAVALVAELHGRMGYFPPVIRLAPIEGSVPRRFAVAEMIDLQQLRDDARRRR